MENKMGMQVTFAAEDQGPFMGRTGNFTGTLKNYDNQEYHCRSLSVQIPVGNSESCLYYNDDKAVIATETPSWDSCDARKGEVLEEAVLIIRMKDGGARPLKNTVKFSVSGNINMAEGTTVLTVSYEYSLDGGVTWKEEKETFQFNKKNPSFYLKNLITSKPDSPANFCTQFAPGEKILFSWEGNGTQYEIYKKGDTRAVYTGTQTSFLYELGITSHTTFLLRAAYTKNTIKSYGELVSDDSGEKNSFRLGNRSLFETITLTTDKPTFSELTVQDKITCSNAVMTLVSSGKQITLESGKDYRKLQFTTDGILSGHLLCSGENSPSSAFIRISVYRDGKERYSARECSFNANLLCADNKSMKVSKPANVTMPVSALDVVIIQSGMETGTGDMKKNGYEAQWFFIPFGKGEAEYL